MRNFVTKFGKILEICKKFAGNQVNEKGNVPRRGVVPTFSDLEVVALSITAEALSIDSENYLFKRLNTECPGAIPEYQGSTYADFVPVINPVTLTAGDKTKLFVIPNDLLTYPVKDSTIKGFRGYFQLKGSAAATEARSFSIDFGGEATRLSGVLVNSEGISPTVERVEIQENSPLLITSISSDNGSGGDLGLGYDDNGGDADEALGRMLFGDWNF